MYISDYAYATDLKVCIKYAREYKSDPENCINNNWLVDTSDINWVITGYSFQGALNNYTYVINSNGNVGYAYYTDSTYNVRPVVYISSNYDIVDGSGKKGDPYILG